MLKKVWQPKRKKKGKECEISSVRKKNFPPPPNQKHKIKLCILPTWEYYKSFFCSFVTGYCYNMPDYEDLVNKPLPKIISRGETIRAAYGERVQLPCHVQQLGEYNHH